MQTLTSRGDAHSLEKEHLREVSDSAVSFKYQYRLRHRVVKRKGRLMSKRRQPKGAPKSSGGQFARDTRGSRDIPKPASSSSSYGTYPRLNRKPRKIETSSVWGKGFERMLEAAKERLDAKLAIEDELAAIERAERDEERESRLISTGRTQDSQSSPYYVPRGNEPLQQICSECFTDTDEMCAECGDWVCLEKNCWDKHKMKCSAEIEVMERQARRLFLSELRGDDANSPFFSRSYDAAALQDYRARVYAAYTAPPFVRATSQYLKVRVALVDMNETDPTNYNNDPEYVRGQVLRMTVSIRSTAGNDLTLMPHPSDGDEWRIAEQGSTISTNIPRDIDTHTAYNIVQQYANDLEYMLNDVEAYRTVFVEQSYFDENGKNCDPDAVLLKEAGL